MFVLLLHDLAVMPSVVQLLDDGDVLEKQRVPDNYHYSTVATHLGFNSTFSA